ncbi:hypothetical protein IWX49DRAFT_551748 [Phyllosticta citricarpa]
MAKCLGAEHIRPSTAVLRRQTALQNTHLKQSLISKPSLYCHDQELTSRSRAPAMRSALRAKYAGILDMSTELFSELAYYLDSKDLHSLCLACRKASQDIQAVLFQHPSVHAHFARQFEAPASRQLMLLYWICPRPPCPKLAHRVPRVAILPRLGGASAHFHVPEDALLRQLLCACSNLNVLHLKIFGDILPVIQIPGGFPDLRKLFLRFLGHGYGQSTSNSVENSCDTSMKDLMWLLKFPRLQ